MKNVNWSTPSRVAKRAEALAAEKFLRCTCGHAKSRHGKKGCGSYGKGVCRDGCGCQQYEVES